MSILDRAALEQSPLADLHTIASELSLDGYRRLRKQQLIDAIIARQGGDAASTADASSPEDSASTADAAGPEAVLGDEAVSTAEEEGTTDEAASEEDHEQEGGRRRRGRRGGGRGRGSGRRSAASEAEEAGEEAEGTGSEDADESEQVLGREERARSGAQAVEGVVELLPNGSAFLRVNPPDPSDDDIYVSAAQVKRCELVSGDRVSGPRRPPRRSERFASLLRVDTINGRPADEVADSTHFDDLPSRFPTERFPLDSEDLSLSAAFELAPIGRGSRVTIAGAAQSGKSELLRRLASALAAREELAVWLVLLGVRPEEVSDWQSGPVAPSVSLTLSASGEAQAQALDGVVDQARRIAARGSHVVVLIDALDAVPPQLARRAMASARDLVDGGSVTLIAAAPAPVGGETTVIALDAVLARAGQFPALDPATTWTMRRELLDA